MTQQGHRYIQQLTKKPASDLRSAAAGGLTVWLLLCVVLLLLYGVDAALIGFAGGCLMAVSAENYTILLYRRLREAQQDWSFWEKQRNG